MAMPQDYLLRLPKEFSKLLGEIDVIHINNISNTTI